MSGKWVMSIASPILPHGPHFLARVVSSSEASLPVLPMVRGVIVGSTLLTMSAWNGCKRLSADRLTMRLRVAVFVRMIAWLDPSGALPAVTRSETMPNLPKYTLEKNERKDRWDLQKDSSGQVVKTFGTKGDATKGGALKRALGEAGGSVKIQKENGRYQEERTYPAEQRPEAVAGLSGRLVQIGPGASRTHRSAIRPVVALEPVPDSPLLIARWIARQIARVGAHRASRSWQPRQHACLRWRPA